MVMANLQPMQQDFVNAYTGNATEAAAIAGYKHPGSQGHRLLKNVEIITAIRERENGHTESLIYTRQQRQQFWTDVMTGKIGESVIDDKGKITETPAALRERIKASELLGKSQADFIERKVVTTDVSVTGTVNIPEIQEVILKYVGQD